MQLLYRRLLRVFVGTILFKNLIIDLRSYPLPIVYLVGFIVSQTNFEDPVVKPVRMSILLNCEETVLLFCQHNTSLITSVGSNTFVV